MESYNIFRVSSSDERGCRQGCHAVLHFVERGAAEGRGRVDQPELRGRHVHPLGGRGEALVVRQPAGAIPGAAG